MKYRVIGLSGLAGSGKDMFYSLLEKQVPNVKRFALADALKDEIRESLIKLYNVDIQTCSREDKDMIRPMLVAHGKIKRLSSVGKHWTGILEPKIRAYLRENPSNVAVVTDIRYDIYLEDEVFWLKETMGGALVHIQLYKVENGGRIFAQAPNVDEAENDPKLQAKADYRVIWPKLINPKNLTPDWTELNHYVAECVRNLND